MFRSENISDLWPIRSRLGAPLLWRQGCPFCDSRSRTVSLSLSWNSSNSRQSFGNRNVAFLNSSTHFIVECFLQFPDVLQHALSVAIFGFQIFQDFRIILFPEPEKGIIPGMTDLGNFMWFFGCLGRICAGKNEGRNQNRAGND